MDSNMTPAEEVEILRACCCVTGADRKTTPEERVALEGLAKKIGVGRASLDAMIERGESDPEFHERQFAILKSEPTQTMAILLKIALSDQEIDADEVRVIQSLGDNLGVSREIVGQLVAAARNV